MPSFVACRQWRPCVITSYSIHYTKLYDKGRQRYCCEQRLARLAKAGPAEASDQLSFDELLTFKPTDADRQFFAQLWQAYVEGRWAGDRDSWPMPIEESLV